MMDAAAIANHLGGRPSSGSFVFKACPICGYQNASIKNGHTVAVLFACPGGCTITELMDLLRSQGLVASVADREWSPPQRATTNDRAKADSMCDLARKVWRGTEPGMGGIVESYLRGRGISLPVPPTVRFARSLKHRPSGLYLPAMVAAFARWPGNGVVAVHRTYLMADGSGKAPVSEQKMTLGPVKGAAIRLAAAGPALIVAEGIETALSAMQATGLPGWAAFSAGNMKELILPALPLAAEVLIAADHDTNGVGQNAAYAAAERWHAEGRKVRIAIPPEAGIDWNDMVRGDTT